MAICKDCIHFEICSPYTAPNESYPEVKDGCRCFKDKQKFIELPCKVGDKIYRVFPKQGIVETKVKRIQYGSYGLMIADRGGVFSASCFGETVFIIRGEAEKALAERRVNDCD